MSEHGYLLEKHRDDGLLLAVAPLVMGRVSILRRDDDGVYARW